MKLSPRTTTTFMLALVTAGLLAGCTTTPTSAPAPSVGASRQATEKDAPLTLPVNTCYKNDGIDSAGDTFTIQIGDKDVPYGQSTCFITDDRATEIKLYRDSTRVDFYATFKASNPYIGRPWLSIKFVDELEPNSHQYAVNDTITYEQAFKDTISHEVVYEFIYTVLRKEDTNEMKQFTVDISLR
ncbi:MAG: hypothetical protein WCJ73_02715 [Actinomycetes bacterium]